MSDFEVGVVERDAELVFAVLRRARRTWETSRSSVVALAASSWAEAAICWVEAEVCSVVVHQAFLGREHEAGDAVGVDVFERAGQWRRSRSSSRSGIPGS
jgi:hypothetical protein